VTVGRVVRVRLSLAAVGAVLFFFGIRSESERLRWLGIGFVGLAWLARFYRPARRDNPDHDPSM
jgi:hypothetical protein